MSNRKDHIEVLKAYPLVIKDQKAIQDAIDFAIQSLEVDEAYQLEYEHTQNIKVYAHDFEVSEEQAEKELRLPYITLDELKEIREEISNIETGFFSYHNDRLWIFQDEPLAILDKKIAELEKTE